MIFFIFLFKKLLFKLLESREANFSFFISVTKFENFDFLSHLKLVVIVTRSRKFFLQISKFKITEIKMFKNRIEKL